jgi:WG containing repeat
MKKNVLLLTFLAFNTFCTAQNIVMVNKSSNHRDGVEMILISPTGTFIKSFKGIDIKGWGDDMICGIDEKTKQLGYISSATGEWAIPPQYKNVSNHRQFSEGLAVVACDGDGATPTLSTVIDKTGKTIVPFCEWSISDFSEGLAIVDMPDKDKVGYFLYGAIDKTGKLVIPFSKGKLEDFKDGLASKGIGSGKTYDGDAGEIWGFMDKTGKMVIKQEWLNADDFSEGLATVRSKEDKLGYIDKTGKLVIPCIYEDGLPFSEGLACVYVPAGTDESAPTATYIDRTGKRITQELFQIARPFSEGLAAVGTEKDEQYTFGFIDKTGKKVIPIEHDAVIISPLFFSLKYIDFKEGLCPTTKGYINKTGKLVIPLTEKGLSDNNDPFKNGWVRVTINDGKINTFKYALMDKTGKILWQSVENFPN